MLNKLECFSSLLFFRYMIEYFTTSLSDAISNLKERKYLRSWIQVKRSTHNLAILINKFVYLLSTFLYLGLSVCLHLYLSVHLSVLPSVFLFIYLPAHFPYCLCVYLPACPLKTYMSISPSVCLPVCFLPAHFPLFICTCLSLYLSAYLPVCFSYMPLCLFVILSVHVLVSRSICHLSDNPFFCLSFWLSVRPFHLYVCMDVRPSVWFPLSIYLSS